MREEINSKNMYEQIEGKVGVQQGKGEVLFNIRAEKLAEKNNTSKEREQKNILRRRLGRFGNLIGQGPIMTRVEKVGPKGAEKIKEVKGDEKVGPKVAQKEKKTENELFYNAREAKRIKWAVRGSLEGEDLRKLREECQPFYKSVESEEEPIKADPENQAKIKGVYEAKYMKYAPSESSSFGGKEKKNEFIKEIEAQAKMVAKQLEVLRVLSERVKSRMAILENSGLPEGDEKLRELIGRDPELGADLLKIVEINEHLKKEEKRWKGEMALPKQFEKVVESAKTDLGRGCLIPLVTFVGRFFKLGWQSIFLKGKKPEEKARHFVENLGKEITGLFSQEFYFLGRSGIEATKLVAAGVGKAANYADRESIERGINKIKDIPLTSEEIEKKFEPQLIKAEWTSLIKTTLMRPVRQRTLLELLEKEGPNKEFLEQFKVEIGEMAKREADQAGSALEKFNERTKAAEQEVREERNKLWQFVQEAMDQLAVDDTEKQEKILKDYYGRVEVLQRGLEQRPCKIAAEILSEKILAEKIKVGN